LRFALLRFLRRCGLQQGHGGAFAFALWTYGDAIVCGVSFSRLP
jgi:hypothetical protein